MEYAIKNNKYYESVPFNIVSNEVFKKVNAIQTEGRSAIILLTKIEDNNYCNYQNIKCINTITKTDFPEGVILKLISTLPFNYTIPGMVNTYYNKTKIEDFLYEITYGNIDYQYAYNYFEPASAGGCSSIRNGNWFGRNFDWYYDNQVLFIVHTPSSLDHYGVLGVAGLVPGINKNNVDNTSITYQGKDMFKLLPFYLLDGINEKGVFCTHNVVPLDDQENPTIVVSALKEEKHKVCIPMVVRFILDKFISAEEAVTYLRDYCTLYFDSTMIDSWKYQSHILIGDSDSTYVLEFIDNKMIIHKANYITNFPITGVKFDKNNMVQYPYIDRNVNKYGFGIERWNTIASAYKSSNTLDGIRSLLKSINYSNMYKEPFVNYSDLIGLTDDEGHTIAIDTPHELCTTAIEQSIENYEDRDRDDPKVGITCHSSIYDIRRKILYIRNLESDIEYTFKI